MHHSRPVFSVLLFFPLQHLQPSTGENSNPKTVLPSCHSHQHSLCWSIMNCWLINIESKDELGSLRSILSALSLKYLSSLVIELWYI